MLLLLTGRLIGYAQEGVFEVQLTIHDSTWLFQLQEHDIRTSDFRVELETSAGRRVFQKGLCNTYKGVVNNDTLQKARFYISDNYLGGNFESGGEMYFITPARFLLEPEEGQNLSLTYVLHKEKLTSDTLLCLSDISTTPDTSLVEFRDVTRYLELAIETDNEFLAQFDYDINGSIDDNERKDAIEFIKMKVNNIAGLYDIFDLQIRLSYVHLWQSPDPYNSNNQDLHVMWNEVRGYWNSNMNHIQRDHVHFLAGKQSSQGYGIDGGGFYDAHKSICGTHEILFAQYDNGYYWAYSYTVSAEEDLGDNYRTAAHELGHAFGLNHICNPCNLMYSGQGCSTGFCGPGTNGFTQWAEESKKVLVNYLNGFNPIYNWDNDACLQYTPPVDYAFQMILEASEVLQGEFANVCLEEEIDATFTMNLMIMKISPGNIVTI
ncbi:MAG: matrixin family metalloprotease [Lewinellaceae bacterium]|nr:matrixin family metalloprotease [Lewinellaceae bacterium]